MRSNCLILIVALVMCLAVSLQADVVIKQKSSVETAGIMNIEIDGVEYIKGNKSYSGGTTRMVGGMAAMMGKGTISEFIQITRLDKEVIWNLYPQNKTYSETSLASLKQMMAKADEAEYKEDEEASDYEWTVDVRASDKEVEINGFKCKSVISKTTGINKEDPQDRVLLTYEYWYTKDAPGINELMDYHDKFSKATGVDIMWTQQSAEKIFDRYGPQFNKMVEKMKKAEGYPIKTVIVVESTEGVESEEEFDEEMPSGMEGMLESLMGKKMQKTESGMVKVFSLSNEVLSIEKKSIDNEKFEIPEGYVKQ